MKSHVVTLFALIISSSSFAADRTMICQVKQTDSDGSQYSFQRRIEFSYDAKHVDEFDNYGQGFEPVDSFEYANITDNRIVLKVGHPDYIDLSSGSYYVKGTQGSVTRGTCH